MNNSYASLVANLEKPPILSDPKLLQTISASSNNKHIFQKLKQGQKFCFEGTWGTAMAFYSWLKKQTGKQLPVHDYMSSRYNRELTNTLTGRLYLPITKHQPSLKKAPENPWLKELYPGNPDFLMRFTDYLGMNGARQWYEKGVRFPNLARKLHPFYGAYFPTRTEHLVLFDQWLTGQNSITNPVDMGTGCGVLTFYLLKHRVNDITATDINPNALYSLEQDLGRYSLDSKVQTIETAFFEGLDLSNTNLVVFNPPWLPQEVNNTLDKAMYYGPDFFEKFFESAHQKIPSRCQMVILFSNFAQVVGLTSQNPIEQECIKKSRFKLVEKRKECLKQSTSSRKHWLSQIRMHEEVELWHLKKR